MSKPHGGRGTIERTSYSECARPRRTLSGVRASWLRLRPHCCRVRGPCPGLFTPLTSCGSRSSTSARATEDSVVRKTASWPFNNQANAATFTSLSGISLSGQLLAVSPGVADRCPALTCERRDQLGSGLAPIEQRPDVRLGPAQRLQGGDSLQRFSAGNVEDDRIP